MINEMRFNALQLLNQVKSVLKGRFNKHELNYGRCSQTDLVEQT